MSELPRHLPVAQPVAQGRTARLTGLAIVAVLAAAAFHWSGPLAAILLLLSAGIAHLATAFTGADNMVAAFNRERLAGRESEPTDAEVLSRVVGAMDTALILLDAEGNIQASSRAARELFPQLTFGKSLAGAVRNPDLLTAVNDAQSTGQPRVLEIFERLPFARRLAVSVTVVAGDMTGDNSRTMANDEQRALLLQFRDLTEQDRLAQMRSDFIANASHELRTPLASLKGFIETLRGPARNDTAARERFLSIMETQSARMARILDDLLSLSRIEMRVHVAPEGEAELSAIVGAVTKSLQPLADEAQIAVRFAPGAEKYVVRGDRDELEQVFQNLIHNAIKYGREGGKVEITITRRQQRDGGRIVISVADDGPGIAEEHLPRLTERFYRVDTATSRERGGTGLGLAIVKHILTRHRGELEITSRLDEGSTFTVVLPALKPEPAAASANHSAGDPHRRS